MLSGRRLDLLDPSPLDIEIEDIAHGLARVARWNGQTTGAHALSVAQHCLLVERVAAELKSPLEPRWRLAALLHDAPEYVVGEIDQLIKRADRVAAFFEATQLAGFEAKEAKRYFGDPKSIRPIRLSPLPTNDVQAKYMKRFQELIG
jgi:5'-deoxynucleotidase YfbR-like HD superfamily hydrolase